MFVIPAQAGIHALILQFANQLMLFFCFFFSEISFFAAKYEKI